MDQDLKAGDVYALPNGFRLMCVTPPGGDSPGRWVNQYGSIQPLPKEAEPLLLMERDA